MDDNKQSLFKLKRASLRLNNNALNNNETGLNRLNSHKQNINRSEKSILYKYVDNPSNNNISNLTHFNTNNNNKLMKLSTDPNRSAYNPINIHNHSNTLNSNYNNIRKDRESLFNYLIPKKNTPNATTRNVRFKIKYDTFNEGGDYNQYSVVNQYEANNQTQTNNYLTRYINPDIEENSRLSISFQKSRHNKSTRNRERDTPYTDQRDLPILLNSVEKPRRSHLFLNDFKNMANENLNFYNKLLHKYKNENIKQEKIKLKKKKNDEILNFQAEREKAKQLINHHINSKSKPILNTDNTDFNKSIYNKENSEFTFISSPNKQNLRIEERKDSIFQKVMKKLKSRAENEHESNQIIKNSHEPNVVDIEKININKNANEKNEEPKKNKKKVDGNGNHIDNSLPKIKNKPRHTEIFKFSESSFSNANGEYDSNRDKINSSITCKNEQIENVNISKQIDFNKLDKNTFDKEFKFKSK